ncbi:MAG: prephenate/arogenate dehydrogenase family protein [Rhodospirillales bacterium]
MFDRVAFIGMGLIGSSLARVLRRDGLAGEITAAARKTETLDTIMELGLADRVSNDPADAVRDADLIMICTPLGAYGKVAAAIGPSLRDGAIVSDVGSAKACVAREVGPHLPTGVHLVPGHPVAGTEHSGPRSGFAELFDGRWCVLTPEPGTDRDAVDRVRALWEAAGMYVTEMNTIHHDRILAITSHLPHVIAYAIVDTANQLGDDLKDEIFQFSASGFRDFTRIAASDPIMWRDILVENRDAVLDVLSRFDEDLTQLKRAIRRGDGDELERIFTRTRAIRRGIIEARQEQFEDQKTLPPAKSDG